MFDIRKYVKDGTLMRSNIAMDIRSHEISSEELEELLRNPDVQATFFGEGFHDRVPKAQWTEKYLWQLACASVAECFNAEYLRYLHEVAEYVYGKKNNPKRIIGIVLLAAAALLVLALVVLKLK